MQSNNQIMHLGVAERGKMYVLENNHKQALRYFKEAIKMLNHQPNSDIFFQHYSQCVMEIMEVSGAYDDVINYCEKVLDLLDDKPRSPFIEKYYSSIFEKIGVQYVLKNEKHDAIDAFKKAMQFLPKSNKSLASELLTWLQRGYTIAPKQLRDLQSKYKYFTIRAEAINKSIAIDLPEAMLPY